VMRGGRPTELSDLLVYKRDRDIVSSKAVDAFLCPPPLEMQQQITKGYPIMINGYQITHITRSGRHDMSRHFDTRVASDAFPLRPLCQHKVSQCQPKIIKGVNITRRWKSARDADGCTLRVLTQRPSITAACNRSSQS
jgi:hypothetical protein